MRGFSKTFRGRRGDPTREEELVPLAMSSSDSDTLDEPVTSVKDDVFGTPPRSPMTNGHLSNGDLYKQKHVVTKEDDEHETRCGYFKCRPDILQKCNNPKALLCFLCCFSMAQGFVVNGINNVSTTSVERRFQLPSSRVGMVSSAYDLSAAILGVFISFLGSGRQKARWLSMACIVMSIGSFVMALPHFTSSQYEWGKDVTLTCSTEESRTSCGGEDSDLQHYLYVLILGQLLHGIGGTTLYTVGVSLIDDSVSASSSPLYIGIMYAFATLGPAMGYIVGGQLLGVYVDFDTVPSSEIRITPDDPRWVGAWWVGFLIASMLFLVAAIPISAYGSELPSAKLVRETRVSEMHADDGSIPVLVSAHSRKFSDLKYLPAGILQLLKTPPFLFVTFAGATEGVIISGFATFMPKFIQNQFGVTAGWASMMTGFMAVPSAAGGQFFGGFLCNRMKLKVKGCIRIAIICCSLALLISAGIWARCGLGKFSGVTQVYQNSSSSGLPSLVSECNSRCHCHTELYEPVCDHFNNQYFSPCHAGCETSVDAKTYRNCSCVPPTMSGTNDTSVTVNKCDQGCHTLYMFLPFMFVSIFLMFVPSPPGVAATLRCIHDSQRTLGLGLKWCIVRLLGTVPGPIIFGAIIDSTCIVWREKCGEHASCWIYDNDLMSRNFFILLICFKMGSIIFFTLAHHTYTPPKEKEVHFIVNADPRNCESVSSTVTILPEEDSPK